MIPNSKKAFTILELLIVVAIVALLAAIIIVSLRSAVAQSRDAKRMAEVDTISKALEFYLTDNESYPGTTGWICIEDPENPESINFVNEIKPYLPVIPKDPLYKSGGEYCYSYKTEAGQKYKLCTKREKGERHCVHSLGGEGIYEEEVCHSGGEAQTTYWGVGEEYGCEGDDYRCYEGECVRCGGLLYNDGDGCFGCAGQGENACWHKGSNKKSCDDICLEYGDCVDANWNSEPDCSLFHAFGYDCNYCNGTNEPGAPHVLLLRGVVYCYYRGVVDQDCTAVLGGPYISSKRRICVCNY